MRNKKLLSTVVATTLAATTMAMPVMAAGESGSLDVDLTTKTGVIRVEVPTQMSIAVDQFEIAQTGAQIASSEFDMVNKSEMAVKIDVTSTATLGTGISLVSGYDAAENSTGDEAWLGIAAKTAASSYDDAATADKAENYYDLTEENANVATFASDTNAAKQTFYLEKGTGTASYALAVPKDNKASVAYAEFYQLTEIATQPTDDDELQAAVDASDVYAVVTANNGKDKEPVTKIAKGTTVAGSANAFANTNTYYTAADTASASVTDGTLYVYATMGAAGAAGSAGFTYVGKLSNARESWTKNDIKKINISYKITGVTGTKYDEVKDDCTYGLYPDVRATACQLQTVSNGIGTDITSSVTSSQGIYIKVNGNFLTTEASKLTSIKINGTEMTPSSKDNAATVNNALRIKLASGTTLSRGDVITLVIDGVTYTFTVAS